MTLKIGVVIPVHNGSRFVEDALNSVMFQTAPVSFSIVCVDDGSADDSVALIRELAPSFPSLEIHSTGSSRGPGFARNFGVSLLNTELVAFLDQDDIWHEDKTERQLEILSNNPSFQFCVGMQDFQTIQDQPLPSWFRPAWGENSQPGYLPSALLVKRNYFLATQGFRTTYRFGGDDVDWFARAIKAGVPHGIVQTAIVTRRVHDSNNSQNSDLGNKELLALIREHLSESAE